MLISGGNDSISCKMFPRNLAEVALKWFKALLARSFSGFEDLACRFVPQFSANKKKEVGLGDLFNLRQGTNEPLKSFLHQFNKATILVKEPNEKFVMETFLKGLRSGGFSETLTVWNPRTMDEVRIRADKHIEAKEMNTEKRRRK